MRLERFVVVFGVAQLVFEVFVLLFESAHQKGIAYKARQEDEDSDDDAREER